MRAWKKAKITVVKKFIAEDLINEFAHDDVKQKFLDSCPAFEINQEFILEKPSPPEGFCPWAWADIHRDLIAVMGGGGLPWMKDDGLAMVCCTDGFRPVVFKIELV